MENVGKDQHIGNAVILPATELVGNYRVHTVSFVTVTMACWRTPLTSAASTTKRIVKPCYNPIVFPRKILVTIMPKLKTHKGASKRFKKTGTGKVVRSHAFGRHILTSKPHKRKKKLHQSVVADKADQPVLKRMLPY